jgi:hypothetical protein
MQVAPLIDRYLLESHVKQFAAEVWQVKQVDLHAKQS